MNVKDRQLRDLEGIGKAMLRDFAALGIDSVSALSKQDPEKLYRKLSELSGPQDVCVLDTFRCAVAQAQDPNLPEAQRKWWYWSRKRKSGN